MVLRLFFFCVLLCVQGFSSFISGRYYQPFKIISMTKYQFLLEKKQEGELSILIKDYGLPSYYPQWMEYYEFYEAHSTMSYTELSCYFHVTRSTIYRAVQFMKSPHIGTVPKLRNA